MSIASAPYQTATAPSPTAAPHIGDTLPLRPLSETEFAEKFNSEPFRIAHNLCSHPLFDLRRLVELSQSLPASSVEYNSGDLPVTQDPTLTPRTGLSIEETIYRIEDCKSWMVLKNVEQDPQYRELLDRCLDQVREVIERIAPGMRQRQGFIFISSAGSVTPFHIDPENNFLLQIRGSKRAQLFDVADRVVISEEQLEQFFTGAHRNIPYKSEFEPRGTWHDLRPGDGLHFPVAAPHWVQNGPQTSISFSITFQTDSSQRRQSLHRLNNGLRHWGLRPSEIGRRPWIDELKFLGVRGIRLAKACRRSRQ
jgi:hypothetical protein